MNYQDKEIILKHTLPNEKLIWVGKPKQGIVFRVQDLYIFPFCLFWLYFVYLWFQSTNINTAKPIDTEFLLMGAPHLLIGLYLLFGRFIYDSYRRKKTSYGLTNNRAVIVTNIFSSKVESIQIKNNQKISFAKKSNQLGTIHFGKLGFWQSFFTKGDMNGVKDSHLPKFELIKDAKSVYNQILTIQSNM